MDRKSAGFTLIELLVVIAVIAVLAAVLIPAVGSSRERAVLVKDLSKLQAIGSALSLYATEHNNRLPHPSVPIPGTASPSDPTSTDRWVYYEAVDRYLDPVPKFNPYSIYNYQKREIWYAEAAGQGPDNSPRRVGFAPNPYMLRSSGDWNSYMIRIPSPARTVIMAEVNDSPGDGGSDLDPRSEPSFSADADSKYRVSRNGSALYLFADYHVDLLEGDLSESVKPEMWTW